MPRMLILGLLAWTLLLAGCGGGVSDEGVTSGKRLPDADLRSLDGTLVRLNQLRGQPLVLNFWATWCAPCRQEMPLLQQAAVEYQARGVSFLAITNEAEPEVRRFIGDTGITLPVYFDPHSRAQARYQIQDLPTTLFVDADGYVVARHSGALSTAQLTDYLMRLLDAKPTPPKA